MYNRKREPLSEEAKNLIHYLERYGVCLGRKKTLEARRISILREFENPLSAINYSGMPKSNQISAGSASLAIKLDEIECKIIEQQNQAAKVLLDVIAVIDFLEDGTLEREVLEHRYIDCTNWERTCKKMHLTRTPANEYWRKALDKLLTFKKVQQIIKEYSESIER